MKTIFSFVLTRYLPRDVVGALVAGVDGGDAVGAQAVGFSDATLSVH